jgi:hypothetical protein
VEAWFWPGSIFNRLCRGAEPIADQPEAKFFAFHGADDELMGFEGFYIEEIAVGARSSKYRQFQTSV